LSRPPGNIMGVTLFIDVLTAKRVELLAEVAPTANAEIRLGAKPWDHGRRAAAGRTCLAANAEHSRRVEPKAATARL
jgi:hypothetical protein